MARYHAATRLLHKRIQSSHAKAGSLCSGRVRACRGQQNMPAPPITSTMDHCLLPAPRGLLRFYTPQKNAHFAGRAGAVMDGSGLEASFGAGHRQIGFDAKTNLLRCRALRPFLSFSPGFLARAYDSGFKNQLSSTRTTRRSQVSARNKIRQSATVVPPTNHHLEALGSPASRAHRGLLVCWREKWRHGSRAHPSLERGTSRIRARARLRAEASAGKLSKAEPSHLCGRDSPVWREPLLVLLLRLLLLVPRPEVMRTLTTRGAQEPRGSHSSNRIVTQAIDKGSGKAVDEPLQGMWAMRGKQSRTRRQNAPESDAGRTEHRQFLSV